MLFNSYDFILIFLPATYFAWLIVGRYGDNKGRSAQWIVLLVASLIFYGASGWAFLGLLAAAVIANYLLSIQILRTRAKHKAARLWLTLGIAGNLAFLFYFKYAVFAWDTVSAILSLPPATFHIVLPLGISFYTFQQIAYLVDVANGSVQRPSLGKYGFFVTFFPQLIAGPIVHHKELIPQLDKPSRHRMSDAAIGLTMFGIGLFKKVVLADSFALIATPVFDHAAAGHAIGSLDAWSGIIAYGLQIYFDFSAYSDMAMGLARLFGITLPINFASPYRSLSVIEFWRRWHITLSRFLRDYLYIPLGGNRGSQGRRYLNIFLTMFLGGIWHGAGFTFALWGLMHGVMIVANHLWRGSRFYRPIPALVAWVVTMLGVFLAWVPFRAADLETVLRLYAASVGLGEAGFTQALTYSPIPTLSGILQEFYPGSSWHGWVSLVSVCLGLAICKLWPNTQTLLSRFGSGLGTKGYETGIAEPRAGGSYFLWRPSMAQSVIVGVVFAICLLKLNDVSEFIYFRF